MISDTETHPGDRARSSETTGQEGKCHKPQHTEKKANSELDTGLFLKQEKMSAGRMVFLARHRLVSIMTAHLL